MIEAKSTALSAAGHSAATDRWIRTPWIIAFILWLLCVLPIAFYGPGAGIFGDPHFWLAVICTLVTGVIAAISILVLLIRCRWRKAVSIVVAAATLVVITAGSLKYRDEMRWLTLRQYYIAQLQNAERSGPYQVRTIVWTMGFDWMITLEYHETDFDVHAWQQKQNELNPDMRHTFTKLEPHYYLRKVAW